MCQRGQCEIRVCCRLSLVTIIKVIAVHGARPHMPYICSCAVQGRKGCWEAGVKSKKTRREGEQKINRNVHLCIVEFTDSIEPFRCRQTSENARFPSQFHTIFQKAKALMPHFYREQVRLPRKAGFGPLKWQLGSNLQWSVRWLSENHDFRQLF